MPPPPTHQPSMPSMLPPCPLPSSSLVPCPSRPLSFNSLPVSPQAVADVMQFALFGGRRHKSAPPQYMSASAMHVELDITSIDPYSGPRIVGFALHSFQVLFIPFCMFLYLFLCFRSFICLASLLLNAFAIGHQVLYSFNPVPAVAL